MVCVLRVLICFFFKQKTAYEMRISDWSSDVCSSDLVDIVRIIAIADDAVIAGTADEGFIGACRRDVHTDRIGVTPAPLINMPRHVDQKIGRASCREGVCQ